MPEPRHRLSSLPSSRFTRRGAFAAAACLCAVAALAAPPHSAPRMRSPLRLAMAAAGTVAVTDGRSPTVWLLDATTLEVVDELRLSGPPLGIAAAAERLYVAEPTKGWIRVFVDRGGHWQPRGRWLGPSSDFGRPLDLAADAQAGLLFVLIRQPFSVLTLDARGRPLAGVQIPAAGEPAPRSPTALAVDPQEREIYVSDDGDPAAGVPAALHVYGYDGRLRATLAGDAAAPGFRFSRPQGAAAYGGEIYLVDSLLGQVLVFDRATLTGQRALGVYGDGPGQLMLPLDVVVDAALGRVLVTNNRLGRVESLADGEPVR